MSSAVDEASLVKESLGVVNDFFSHAQCAQIEACIDCTAHLAAKGIFQCPRTIDSTPNRTKYFFGYGYTYGQGVEAGRNEIYAPGEVDEIPGWIIEHLIRPLEASGAVPYGFINSAVINDYYPGSSIVSHVDPPAIFERPIFVASFFSEARLVFGASFDIARKTPPVYSHHMHRGSILVLRGYSADKITHGILPEDLLGKRRTSIVLRRVREDAPVKGSRNVSDLLMSREKLVQGIQGRWLNELNGYSYIVAGLKVNVIPPSKVKVHREWILQPSDEGLKCGAGVLTEEGVSDDCLRWSRLWGGHDFLWKRLVN